MIKKILGKQSVSVYIGQDDRSWELGMWLFCQNGHQSTGVDVSIDQFDMLKELVTNPDVVEYYESLRKKLDS